MRGRGPGLVLMLLAMTAVVAGHGLIRTDVSGAAVAIAVAGPPRSGDCVLSAPDPALPDGSAVGDAVSVAFGPCSGVVAGEIVSVRPGRATARDGSIGAVMGTSGDCWAAASRYVGFVTAGGVAAWPSGAPSPIDWRVDLRVRGQVVGADLLQKAVGRDWSACVVRPENLEVYLGSARGALRTGAAPAAYGDCSPSLDPTALSEVDCSNPHPTERLGWAAIPAGSMSRSQLDRSCRAFAGRLLRTDDPTYSGLLNIVATQGDITTCVAVVREPARLIGSLIGIADGPLPLAT